MDSERDMLVEEETGAEEAAPEQEVVAEPATAGGRLRAAREEKRLELSHIAAETRIPIRHLEAIEAGEFDQLPSRTYAIGFARTYADAVDLDRKEIVDLVREELADDHYRTASRPDVMEPGDAAKLPSAGLAWAGGAAALLLAVGLVAFFSTYFGAGEGLPSLIAESDEVVEEAPQQAEAAPAQPAAPSADGQVVFTATGEGTWVRFYEQDGERLFEGVMEDGDTFEVPADASDPRINTGRPHLLTITIDGQSVPPLADEQVTLGDAQVSAAALLARADAASEAPTANN